ncbi:MAG TPA: hypothetical protein VF219_16155 [Vicinamibacterales bacterium]
MAALVNGLIVVFVPMALLLVWFNERQHDDERRCCILKGHPDKRSWEFHDGETRESCAEMARQARMNWSFHKNRKCEAFKP